MTGEIEFQHGRLERDVGLHYVEAGEGPLVVLLHGFPEFWYSWRHQLRALADAGFHAVAPDMRGYNESDKPEGTEAYTRPNLTGDVADLIDHFGADEAVVAGHDWGGVVAWVFAMDHPSKLSRLAILNCPHPIAMAEGMKDWRQMLRAIHMFLFQVPLLPETLLPVGDFALLRRIFRDDPVRDGAFSEEDIDRYVDAISKPGALSAALNYYRAASRHGLIKPLETIDREVRIIWGEQDRYLGANLAEPPDNLVSDYRVDRLGDASHWVQVDRPDRVNELLVDFCRDD